MAQGKGCQAEFGSLAELRSQNSEFNKSEVVGISRVEYQRGGSYTEKELQKSWGGPLDSAAKGSGSCKLINSRAITRLRDIHVPSSLSRESFHRYQDIQDFNLDPRRDIL